MQLTQQPTVDPLTALTQADKGDDDDTVCDTSLDSITVVNGHDGEVTTPAAQDSNILASVSSTTSSLSDVTDGHGQWHVLCCVKI